VYTKLDELQTSKFATPYEKAVMKLRYESYHTTIFEDEVYALHELGVSETGIVTCCKNCANKIKKCCNKMEKQSSKSKETLFFKFDPTVDAGDCIRDNNVVRMHPITDTWLEWDYGKCVTHYIAEDGTRVALTDKEGNCISLNELSDGEMQALSPLLVASKIIKLSSTVDKHIGHKVKGHILTLPTSSSREIYKTKCTVLPRLDVAKYNRIMYLGTLGKYSSQVAFRLNAQRHAMRQTVVESYTKAMRQTNDLLAEHTKFRSPTEGEWRDQVEAYQGK